MLLTRDIPPSGEDIPISEDGARIYFGELTDHYVIVKTNEPEFDYPTGDTTVETSYEPDRGIALSNPLRRLALAWQLGDRNLLISGQLRADSRVLMHRSLEARIRKVAPFLELDADPYLVVVDGGLRWIQDAYTVSGNYPYSQHLGAINYVRNSVKVVVDAETGDMTFYLIGADDPIAATWDRIFPDLFTPADAMPPEIRAHLRYPEGMFRLQAEQYLRYHIRDPRTFFIGEDLWAIPMEKFRQQEQLIEPYYVIMRLPGEEREEFSLILPFTPRNKQNTIAWLAGRSDGEHYGTLRAYRFPTDDLVFGPAQIEARIDQDPGISAQLTLWEGAGSEVIRGNLLMIPIGESFLFIEPIYLQAESSRIPELRRVVVANGNTIAFESTFERSLDVVFGRRARRCRAATARWRRSPQRTAAAAATARRRAATSGSCCGRRGRRPARRSPNWTGCARSSERSSARRAGSDAEPAARAGGSAGVSGDVRALEAQLYMQAARRLPVTLVRGEGTRVWDAEGAEYLDFVAGISTNAFGHADPGLAEVIAEQARRLVHCSNIFYSEPQIELAQLLVGNSCLDRVFFANSGAEANEGALKLARKWGRVRKGGAHEIIVTHNGFLGRTMATVAATGTPAYREPFEPLVPGFVHVDFGDLEAIQAATTPQTAAVMLEPIQAEGGIIVPPTTTSAKSAPGATSRTCC